MPKWRVSRLARFVISREFRADPLRSVYRRLYWRLHWMLWPQRPFLVRFCNDLSIQLANSSASCGIYVNNGFSDRSVALLFIEYLKPGMVAMDCGAHIGEYTLLFASLVGPEGRVYAFEPDPRVFAYLEKNVALNRLSNVVVKNLALGGSEGKASFVLHPDPTASHLSAVVREDEPLETIGVGVTSIDACVRSFSLEHLDALKIDVEGAEIMVLDGAIETLSSLRPGLIFVECESPSSAPEITRRLSALGYHVEVDQQGHRFPHVIARHTGR